MHRRSFLQLAGASLGAGCSGFLQSDREASTDTVTPVPIAADTETPPRNTQADDPDPRLPPTGGTQVVDLETGPRTLAIPGGDFGTTGSAVGLRAPDGATVHVGFTETATADHPATVRATLLNANDWGNRFRLEDVPAFAGANYASINRDEFDRRFESPVTDDPEPALYLAPTGDHDLVDEDPQIERGPGGYWRTEPFPPALPDVVTLAAGDFVTGEYYVLGHWDRTGFPAGRYDFDFPDDGFALVAWDAAAPGPSATTRFTGSVGSLPNDEETPWFHEADESTEFFLRPDRERVNLPARVSFRLVNHTRERLTGNPNVWELYKWAQGAWRPVVPRRIPAPVNAVTPGETYGYALSLFHERGFEADDEHADLARSIDRLGGGRYAFVSGFSAPTGDAPAAMFEVEAPAVPLSLPDDAVRYRAEDHVVVTLPEWRSDADGPDATLTVRRVDGGGDETIVREAITREPMRALESALAAIGDDQRVVVKAGGRLVETVMGVDSKRRFTFDGEAYLATAEFEE